MNDLETVQSGSRGETLVIRRKSRLARVSSSVFVLGTWLFLTLIAFWFVAKYGNRTPRWEDWLLVPYLTGSKQPTLGWLWESYQGHRAPILKALFYTNYQVFGFTSKPLLFLNAALLSALALGLLWAIRASRGRFHYSDAFFPIVLLNLGHQEAFGWAQTFVYVISTCIMGAILILIVLRRDLLRPSDSVVAGGSLLILPLIFGGGVVFAAPMLMWLTYRATRLVRIPGPLRRYGVATFCLVGITAAIIGLYFVGYKRLDLAPARVAVQPSVRNYVLTAWKYLAMSFGSAAWRPIWPASGLLIAVILAVCFVCLVCQVRNRRIFDDARILGLAAYMASCLAVAATVGIGRYAWGEPTIFNSRYVTAAVPPLLGAYFVWEFCGPRRLVPLGRMVLFSIVCGFLSLNYERGKDRGQKLHDLALDFEKDRSAGMSIPELVSRHSWITYYYHDRLETFLRQLRDAHVEKYRHLPQDPIFREQSLPLATAVPHGVKWDGHQGEVVSPEGSLQFDLDKSRFVSGLRIRLACSDPRNMSPFFRVTWAQDPGPYVGEYQYLEIPPSEEYIDILIFIYKRISNIRIYPNNRPSAFRLSGISALLPEND
jgi:hypothetical protein